MSVSSDPHRFRKLVAGVALIGFPLAGFVSCLPDSAEGTGRPGSDLAKYVGENASGIHTSGLVLMLSALLTVPAALGVAHLLRRRGVVLGHIGAACLAVGAFGHFAYGFWQVLLSQAQGLDVVEYLGRMSSQSNLLLPEMILVDVGVLLLSIGLVRSRAVPVWPAWATIVGVGLDVVVKFSGTTAAWPVTAIWGLLVLTWGYIGLSVLRMKPTAWAAFDVPAVRTPEARDLSNAV